LAGPLPSIFTLLTPRLPRLLCGMRRPDLPDSVLRVTKPPYFPSNRDNLMLKQSVGSAYGSSVALSHAAFVSDAKFVDGRFVATNPKTTFIQRQPTGEIG
jgi:hypothetical protein